jgi:serine/threonine protein kinase
VSCDYDIYLFCIALTAVTDLQENNILLAVEDKLILADFEEAERSEPSPRKIDGDRIIYASRELRIPKIHGRPVLSDFGEARFGEEDYDDDIQPYIYRAPEVILQMRWNNKVDIWNVGVMVCCLNVTELWHISHSFTSLLRQ